MSGIVELDTRVFILLNQTWTAHWLDVVMPFLTDFDNWRYPVIVVLLVFLARGSTEVRVGILFAVLAVVAADQISASGVKPLVERLRPFHVIEGTRKLVGAHDYSFPSSHAANTFAAGTFLAIRFRRMAAILVIPVLVSYSRIYVGVHYPLDVLAGAALGATIGLLFVSLERAVRLRLGDRFAALRRLPGGEAEKAEPAGKEEP